MSARGTRRGAQRVRRGAVWRSLGLPLQLVVVLVAIGLVVVAGLQWIGKDPSYHARLRHSAGLEAGDDVRIAGITVGRVTSVTAERDQVDVAFTLDEAPEEIGVTGRSNVEVKLLSILGQRYLSLTPGSGSALADGATIAVTQALDTYTMDRFWLESTPVIEELELETLQRAVDVLATDLRVAPDELNRALEGISGVSRMVTDRQAQLDRLLSSTQAVTDLVLDQTEEIDTLLDSGEKVLTMVHRRRETLRVMLAQAHRFVTGLTAVVREAEPDLVPALRDMRRVLKVLDEHRDDLDETLRLAGPMTRVFTNSAGDGPWLGVNAPNAIFSDDFFCTLLGVVEDCS